MGLTNTLHRIYFNSTGYSFTNLGRLFLRMFIGLMLAQFGVRQLMTGPDETTMCLLPYVEAGLSTWLIIVVEIICSLFIMIGLFMRLMILPPFILMIVSAHRIFEIYGAVGIFPAAVLTIPFLFMGVYMFMLLVGPGKISLDYFYSLYLISRHHNGKEEDLEEV